MKSALNLHCVYLILKVFHTLYCSPNHRLQRWAGRVSTKDTIWNTRCRDTEHIGQSHGYPFLYKSLFEGQQKVTQYRADNWSSWQRDKMEFRVSSWKQRLNTSSSRTTLTETNFSITGSVNFWGDKRGRVDFQRYWQCSEIFLHW